jgi:hypothetical protein
MNALKAKIGGSRTTFHSAYAYVPKLHATKSNRATRTDQPSPSAKPRVVP